MTNWRQIRIGSIGSVAEGIEDINQCIKTILLTPKGAVPHRPEFGADILKYIDMPSNTAIPLIIAEAMRAINENEPRVRVSSIKADVIDGHHITLRVSWTLADEGNMTYLTEVTI